MTKRLEYAPGRVAEVSSVGVVIHTQPLIPSRDKPYFLFVEQADQESRPWGIPAGGVEPTDQTAMAAAVREVGEETGLIIDSNRLELFAWWEKDWQTENPIKVVYSYLTELSELLAIGAWEIFEPRPALIVQGRPVEIPQIYVLRENPLVRARAEISAMALIPAMRMFERGNGIAGHPYRWDSLHYVKNRLSALRVI